MFRNLIIAVLLVCSTILLGGCEQKPQLSPLAADAVVLAFGDSLTYGSGAGRNEAYPAVLSGLLARTVVNAGIPGEITAAGRQRLPQELARYNPALMILCHGGNDFLRRLDGEQTRANLEQMILAARENGTEVLLVGVPKLGFGLDVPTFYADLAKEYQLPLEDDILIELLGDRQMKSDAIHPNATGYQRMAKELYALIRTSQGAE